MGLRYFHKGGELRNKESHKTEEINFMQLLRKKFSKFLILRFCRIFVKMVISKEFKGGKLRNPKIKLKRTHTNIDKSERRISQE